MFLTILITLVCVYLAYVIACRHFLPRINEEVPTFPGKLPLIGHSYMFLKNETLVRSVIAFGEYALKVGGVTKMFMGPLPVYIVADPVDVTTVLNKCLKRMFVYRFIEPMVGKQLIAADVPVWKRNRRLLDPCFKQHLLDNFLKLFSDRAGKFVELIAADAGKGEVDLTDTITKSVLETACQTTLGARVDGKDLVDSKYVVAVNELLDIPTVRIYKPWLMLDFIFNLSSLKQKLKEAIAICSKLSANMIEIRKSELLKRLKNKEDFDYEDGKFQSVLDVLLENTVTETGSVFTDIEMTNIMDNVLVAGFDTTITEMLYAFVCIGTYPEVQEKIFQEITQVLGEDGKVTKENISQLIYLEAAIKEALRLYPAGAIVGREATVDTKLRHMTIPAGSSVLVHIWSVNKNTAYWGSDAEEYKPERWLNSDTPGHKGAFATFSPGLRGCIGKTYAIMYLKATMAPILRRFKFAADHTKMKLMANIFVKPVSGHLVKIEDRRPNK